ncbi:MAG: hypothetical protein QXP42_05850, partial [Candidatus Micrarchaeia archaeon]
MTPEAIDMMGPIDASRIDLKAFSEKFYREVCGGASLEHVLNSIKLLHARQHIEIIVLLIPTKNDSPDELAQLSKWVADLDKNIPVHFTAYYPANRMQIAPTSVKTLEMARRIAFEQGVRYAYTGNVPGHEGENTYCHNCGELLIRRIGFNISEYKIKNGRCPNCCTEIPIIEKLERR